MYYPIHSSMIVEEALDCSQKILMIIIYEIQNIGNINEYHFKIHHKHRK